MPINDGNISTATHGMKVVKGASAYPRIDFGGAYVSNGSMNGLEAGKTYTLSFDYEVKLYSGTISTTGYFRAYLYTANDGDASTTNTAYKTLVTYTSSNYGKVITGTCDWSFTIPSDVSMADIVIMSSSPTASYYADSDYIKLTELKLEEGASATPFTLNAQDTVTALESRVKTNEGAIEVMQDQIDLKVTESGVLETLRDHNYTSRNLLFDSNAPDLTKVYAGADRYFTNSTETGTTTEMALFNDCPCGAAYGFTAKVNTANTVRRGISFYNGTGSLTPVTIGGKYTMSCWVRKTAGSSAEVILQYGVSSYNRQSFTITGTAWQRVSWTFTAKAANCASSSGVYSTRVAFILYGTPVATVDFCGFQLEQGEVATDWTPNVGEYSHLLDSRVKSAEIKIEPDKITSTVLDTVTNELTDDKGTSTSLVKKLSAIEQTASGIDLRVTKTEDAMNNLNTSSRNLFKNTLNAVATPAASRPMLVGQTYNTVGAGTLSTAEHGLKSAVTSATYPYLRFGHSSYSSEYASMNGLEAGKTYTISFDYACKLCSGSPTVTNVYLRVYLFPTIDTGEDAFAGNSSNGLLFGTILVYGAAGEDFGSEQRGHYSWTFTVPETCKKCYLTVRPNSTTSSFFASGDFIELKNLMLVEGAVASSWIAAPEDMTSYADKSATDAAASIKLYVDGDTYKSGIRMSADEITWEADNSSLDSTGHLEAGSATFTNAEIDCRAANGWGLSIGPYGDLAIGTVKPSDMSSFDNECAFQVNNWGGIKAKRIQFYNSSKHMGEVAASEDGVTIKNKYDVTVGLFDSTSTFGGVELRNKDGGPMARFGEPFGTTSAKNILYWNNEIYGLTMLGGAKASGELNANGSINLQNNDVKYGSIVATTSSNETGMFIKGTSKNLILITDSESKFWQHVNIATNCDVGGALTVKGTKNRRVTTDDFGDVLLSAYETPTPMFGDVGEGVIGVDGLCYVTIDPVFAQTISTNNYQVFLQKYGEGDMYVLERKSAYFIVKGMAGLSFGWEVKGKQRDFDQLRLEKPDAQVAESDRDYGAESAEYIEQIQEERLQ